MKREEPKKIGLNVIETYKTEICVPQQLMYNYGIQLPRDCLGFHY